MKTDGILVFYGNANRPLANAVCKQLGMPLAVVKALAPSTLWPTHGSPVTDVAPFIDAFIEHRLDRERNILACVRAGEALIPDIVRRLYVGVNEKLYRAAARSVLAHMIKLVDDGFVRFDGPQPGVKTPYFPADA